MGALIWFSHSFKSDLFCFKLRCSSVSCKKTISRKQNSKRKRVHFKKKNINPLHLSSFTPPTITSLPHDLAHHHYFLSLVIKPNSPDYFLTLVLLFSFHCFVFHWPIYDYSLSFKTLFHLSPFCVICSYKNKMTLRDHCVLPSKYKTSISM